MVGVGYSDHLGLVIKKLAKFPVSKPQTVSRRSYKNFDIRSFLTEENSSNINQEVSESNYIDEAAEFYENLFRSILDKHAPIKTIQIRKNFSPFISNKTKEIILDRKALSEEAAKTDCKILKRDANRLGKVIKKKLIKIGPSTLKKQI